MHERPLGQKKLLRDKPTMVRMASLWPRTVEEDGLEHKQHHLNGEVGGETTRGAGGKTQSELTAA